MLLALPAGLWPLFTAQLVCCIWLVFQRLMRTHPSLSELLARESLKAVGLALVGLSSSVQLPQLRLLPRSLIRSNAARYFSSASLALSRMPSSDSTDALLSGDPGCALTVMLLPTVAANSVLDTDARPRLDASSDAALKEASASEPGRWALIGLSG